MEVLGDTNGYWYSYLLSLVTWVDQSETKANARDLALGRRQLSVALARIRLSELPTRHCKPLSSFDLA